MLQKVPKEFAPRWHSIFYNPFYIIRKKLFKAIAENASYVSGDILDFGCGSKPYKDIFNTKSYIGLEYASDKGNSETKPLADVFYDGKTIPFGNDHFDSVFSSEVLEHVFNPDEILSEIHRVLKPGGHLLLTCPFFWPEHEQPFDFARYTSFGLQHLMKKHGFEVINYQKTGSYFESLLQGMALYVYYFIPHKPKVLETLLFTIFITPFLCLGMLIVMILPKRIKRSDFYLNNVIVVRKP